MPKVFDQVGNIIETNDDVILNDLTKAPILQDLPTDGPVYYVVAVPSENSGPLRLALIMPKVVATVKALAARIAAIELMPGPPGKDGINGLSGKDGQPGKDGLAGINGKDGTKGADGLPGIPGTNGTNGKDGLPGTPTRIERYTSFATDATGLVKGTFSTPFAELPDCDVVESWTSTTPPQQVVGSVTKVTLTGFEAQIMLSQGTLLLNAAPFVKATVGIKPIIRVIGR